MEIESKKFLVEVKSNNQGKFVKILEVREEREKSCLNDRNALCVSGQFGCLHSM